MTSNNFNKNHCLTGIATLIFLLVGLQPVWAQSDYDKGIEAYQNEDFKKARNYWEDAASDDNLSAIFNLGILLSKGIGGSADPERAVNLFRRAGDAGLAMAQHNLALAYYSGRGVHKDTERARIWWERAARQGHIKSQFNLGVLLWNGDGGAKEADEAVKWFRQASKAGNEEARTFLEKIFKESDKLATTEPSNNDETETSSTVSNTLANASIAYEQQNYSEALTLWQKAAKLGSASASYQLAQLYKEGLGVNQDLGQAFSLTEQSAQRGLSQAQYQLAKYYLEGGVVAKNETLALYWMQSAADNQHIKAKDHLEQLR